MLRPVAFFLGSLVLLACGDDGGGGGSGGTGAGQEGGGGAGAAGAAGGGGSGAAGGGGATGGGGGGNALDLSECDDDTDCPGGMCVNLNGSYRVCQYAVVEATDCTGSKSDTCCNTSECGTNEICVAAPATPFCGGIQIEPHNECASDLCDTDVDCGDEAICAPAGTVGNMVKMCLPSTCISTCGQESLSPCALMRDPCCNNPAGFYCAFECHTDAECPGGYCNLGSCEAGAPICPA